MKKSSYHRKSRVVFYNKRILLSIVTIMALLGGGELVLRALGFRYKALEIPTFIWNPRSDSKLITGMDLHVPDNLQIWIPRSGAVYDKAPQRDVINDAGYRGQLLSIERRPDVLRIATLGDSSTFGWGVDFCDTYLSRLQVELGGEESCEILNGGVIGYSVRQGLERYRKLVRLHKPDIVVTAFGAGWSTPPR